MIIHSERQVYEATIKNIIGQTKITKERSPLLMEPEEYYLSSVLLQRYHWEKPFSELLLFSIDEDYVGRKISLDREYWVEEKEGRRIATTCQEMTLLGFGERGVMRVRHQV